MHPRSGRGHGGPLARVLGHIGGARVGEPGRRIESEPAIPLERDLDPAVEVLRPHGVDPVAERRALVVAEGDPCRDADLAQHHGHQARELLAEPLALDQEVGERLRVVPIGHVHPVGEVGVRQVPPDRHDLVVVGVEPSGPEPSRLRDRGRDRGKLEVDGALVRGLDLAQVSGRRVGVERRHRGGLAPVGEAVDLRGHRRPVPRHLMIDLERQGIRWHGQPRGPQVARDGERLLAFGSVPAESAPGCPSRRSPVVGTASTCRSVPSKESRATMRQYDG